MWSWLNRWRVRTLPLPGMPMSANDALQGGRDPALQMRVEACLQDWEKANDRVHPLRWVPIDLIAQSVLMETGRSPTDSDIAIALKVILHRTRPPNSPDSNPLQSST